MAQIDLYGNPVDDRWSTQPTSSYLAPGGTIDGGGFSNNDARIASGDAPQGSRSYASSQGAVDVREGLDVDAIRRQLQEMSGGLYDESDLNGVLRNTGYSNHGRQSLAEQMAHRASGYADRHAELNADTRGNGGGGGGGRGGGVPSQFDDPYTNQLERLGQAQLGEIRSNPGLDQLMTFLNKQFSDLSNNPGYNTEEMALLNTQALEPIEARRQAAQQRSLERTASRGFLPSSGLNELDLQANDQEYDQQRTVAGRDLAVNAIGQRQADLNQAMQVASLIGLDIPRSQRSEEMNVANTLYQLPRNALQDLMMVLNGSPNSSQLFSQGLQAQNVANQQSYLQDQQNQQLMQQIGGILSGLFS